MRIKLSQSSRFTLQSKLKKRMSHLVLVTQVTTLDPEGGLPDEEVPEEERPLLVEGQERSSSSSQREDSKLTKTFSLMPDATLSNQVKISIINFNNILYESVNVTIFLSVAF